MKGKPYVCIIFFSLLAVLVVGCSSSEPFPSTPTPEPAPSTPTPTCPTDSEQRYFDDLTGKMRSIGAQYGTLGEDLARAAEDTALLRDEVWVIGVENTLYIIDRQANGILALSGPESTASVSHAAQQMAQRIQTSMQFYEQGLASLDFDILEQGADYSTPAGDDAEHIYGLIASFCLRR